MRSAIAILLAAAAVLAAFGCGRSTDDSTPVACLEGEGTYLRALQQAPGEVELSDGVPISDCLAANQQAGDLATVGTALVEGATKLNGEARTDPGGAAAVRLGYLIGAAERGAERTAGIHAELLRRLTVAARFSPEGPLPAAFLRAYREGFDAGRDGG